MSKYEDLNKLEDLRQKGILSEEEFQREKAKILKSDIRSGTTSSYSGIDTMFGLSENSYLMLMHLSQLAGFLAIVLWLINAKNSPVIDKHGRNIANFMISMAIYFTAAAFLSIIIIGIPILIVLGILYVVFLIMAAVKADRGEYWKYPLSITFFPDNSL